MQITWVVVVSIAVCVYHELLVRLGPDLLSGGHVSISVCPVHLHPHVHLHGRGFGPAGQNWGVECRTWLSHLFVV